MIVKKIATSGSKAKGKTIADLTNYILCRGDQTEASEKLLSHGGRNFLCADYVAQQQEMIALAHLSRSKNPVTHYIISWREGERPTVEQVEEAVDIFLGELGYEEHQAFYALHQNTDNYHLHLVVNRVHPCLEKICTMQLDVLAAHRAIAKIERQQGWEPEKNARYQFINGQLVERRGNSVKLHHKARDYENLTGEKSALRIAIEEGTAVLRRAQSWEELHRSLAERGMRYEKKGRGAILFVGETPVKASDVDRNGSLRQMEQRLGLYCPPIQPVKPVTREREPLAPNMRYWDVYMEERQAHYEQKELETIALGKRQEQERKILQNKHGQQRQQIWSEDWTGRLEKLYQLRQKLAKHHASERGRLKAKHRQERGELQQQFPPFPTFEDWLRSQGEAVLAELWRYRENPERVTLFTGYGLPRRCPPPPSLLPQRRGYSTIYIDPSQSGKIAFADKGDLILVFDPQYLDTARQFAKQKWDQVECPHPGLAPLARQKSEINILLEKLAGGEIRPCPTSSRRTKSPAPDLELE